MKTITKLVLAAASGYALRAYSKRDVQMTEEAVTHPDNNQRIMDDGFNAFKSPFMNRQAEKLLYKMADKITGFIFDERYMQRYQPRTHNGYRSSRYNRTYAGNTRYARFGRQGRN